MCLLTVFDGCTNDRSFMRQCQFKNVREIDNPAQLEPVIANHILTGKTKSPLLFPGDFVRDDVFVHKRLRRVQYLIEQFWSRWKQEYLAQITFRQK